MTMLWHASFEHKHRAPDHMWKSYVLREEVRAVKDSFPDELLCLNCKMQRQESLNGKMGKVIKIVATVKYVKKCRYVSSRAS